LREESTTTTHIYHLRRNEGAKDSTASKKEAGKIGVTMAIEI
jgi:hypothetical protein